MRSVSSTTARLLIVSVAALVICGAADERPYRINSKEVGWDAIDLTITEVRRNGSVSVLRIPRYAKRSAMESRFAMCAFTDIAIQRGFEAWVVSGADVLNDLVRVGFLKSSADDAAKVLGKEFAGDAVLRTEVETINKLCGIERVKK